MSRIYKGLLDVENSTTIVEYGAMLQIIDSVVGS